MQIKAVLPKEYIEELKGHPYVERVTEWSISFSSQFKKIAFDEYKHGKSMRQIFKDAGFDTEILGDRRISNFRNHLMKKAEKSAEFEDARKNNGRKDAVGTEAQMAKRIRELEHRNAYLEQENEFLKKIRSAEEECCKKTGGVK